MLPPFRPPRIPQLPDLPRLPRVEALRSTAVSTLAAGRLPPLPQPPGLPDLPRRPGVAGLQEAGPGSTAAVADPSRRQLMTLGLFVFGMDTVPYQALRHAMEWRHGTSDRHQALPASQFLGKGPETVTISGLLVPEIAGSYSSFDRLEEMAGTGEAQPLMDGSGKAFGHFTIVRFEREHMNVMAGGIPRQVAFSIDLERTA